MNDIVGREIQKEREMLDFVKKKKEKCWMSVKNEKNIGKSWFIG